MKYLILTFCPLLIYFYSCQNAEKSSPAKNNSMNNDQLKEWYLSYIDEIWNKRDFTKADKYWGADFKNVFAPQFEHGPAGMKNQVEYFLDAFDSFHFEIKDMMVDGDKISIWAEITGKHTGELFGIKATGREVKFREAAWYKLKDGKLDEVYPFVDWNTLFEQLGQYPALTTK
jgi:predicted ester cyclase